MLNSSVRNQALRTICRAYPFSKGRYRLMKLCEGLQSRREETVGGVFGHYRMSLDLGERGLQSSFYYFIPEKYEADTQRYISDSVKPGMVTMDIGAHMGLFSILLADKVGPKGRVYSFEPEAKNFARLKTNLALNGLACAKAYPYAVSERTGTDTLVLDASDAGHALAGGSDAAGASRQTIETISLDDFVLRENVACIDLMKIDAEKSEHRVLAGARRIFQSGNAVEIICEVHSSSAGGDVGGDRIRKIFYGYGYKSYILNPMLSGRKYLSERQPREAVTGLQNLLFRKSGAPHV